MSWNTSIDIKAGKAKRLRWLGAALAAAAACSTSTPLNLDGLDTGGVQDEAMACADFASQLCQRRWECIPLAFSRGHGHGDAFGTEARCVERMTLACRSWQQLPGARATPSALEACALQIADYECHVSTQTLTRPTVGCELERGSLKDGTACELALQCSSGNCESLGGQLACAAARAWWQTPDALGAACGGSSACGVNLVCLDGRCVAPALAGEPCGEGLAQCAPYAELRCGDAGVCVALDVSSGACGLVDLRAQAACESGECVGFSDRGQGYCRAYADDGATCDYSIPCLYPAQCAEGICRVRGARID